MDSHALRWVRKAISPAPCAVISVKITIQCALLKKTNKSHNKCFIRKEMQLCELNVCSSHFVWSKGAGSIFLRIFSQKEGPVGGPYSPSPHQRACRSWREAADSKKQCESDKMGRWHLLRKICRVCRYFRLRSQRFSPMSVSSLIVKVVNVGGKGVVGRVRDKSNGEHCPHPSLLSGTWCNYNSLSILCKATLKNHKKISASSLF